MATTEVAAPAESPGLRRRVFKLALPAVGEQVLNTMVGLVDTFLVGHLSVQALSLLGYSSAEALAGVGLANQLVWFITMMLMAVAVGATALIARAIGGRDTALASLALRQSLLLGLGLGLLATAAGVLFAEPALRLLGAEPAVVARGTEYLRIVAAGFVPATLLFIGTAALRGAGDTRTPLYVMLGVNAVNLAVAWTLIEGHFGLPTLGVQGAALAAVFGRGAGGVAVLVLLFRGRGGLRLNWDCRPDFTVINRILQVGAPAGGEQLVFQSGLLLFVGFVTGLGTAAYAAHNVVITIESLSFLPGMGFAAAATTLVGQALGARDQRLASDSAYEALRQGGLMMIVLGVVMIAFPAQLIRLFAPDPAVVVAGTVAMQMAGLLQAPLALNLIISGALRGAGDTRWPLLTKIVSTWGARLPLVFLLVQVLDLGMLGAWLAMGADFTIQGLLALWRFRGGAWVNARV